MTRKRALLLVALAVCLVLAAAWYFLSGIDGRYHAGLLHCLCDSEQYIDVADGRGVLVHYHPDRSDSVVFTYEAIGWRTYRLTFVGPCTEWGTATVWTTGLGICTGEAFFAPWSADVRPPTSGILFGRYWLVGN